MLQPPFASATGITSPAQHFERQGTQGHDAPNRSDVRGNRTIFEVGQDRLRKLRGVWKALGLELGINLLEFAVLDNIYLERTSAFILFISDANKLSLLQ